MPRTNDATEDTDIESNAVQNIAGYESAQFQKRSAVTGTHDGEFAIQRCPHGGKGSFHGFQAVAVATQVGEIDVLPTGARDAGEQLARTLV